MGEMKTARFWIWNNGPVKLTIRPGQTLRHTSFSEDEEGWSSREDEWTNDGEKSSVAVIRTVVIAMVGCRQHGQASVHSTVSPPITSRTMESVTRTGSKLILVNVITSLRLWGIKQ